MTRGRAIASAVVGRAQVRAALEHLARYPDLRLAGVVARGLRPAARVFWNTARLRRISLMLGRPPVGGPFPYIAAQVVDAVAVRRERHHRRGALEAIMLQVLVRELPLPSIRHVLAVWGEFVT